MSDNDTTPTTITIPAGTRCTITLHGDGDGDTAPADEPRQPPADSDDVVPLPPGEAVRVGDHWERWLCIDPEDSVKFEARDKLMCWAGEWSPDINVVRRAAAYLNQQHRAERATNKEQQ